MTNPKQDDLISPEYRQINNKIYSHAGQSMGGAKYTRLVPQIIKNFNAASILDYGCGQGQFKEALDALNHDIVVTEYDPCIEGKEALPEPVDFLLCADVLEHIEPEKIDEVLKHIFSLTKKGGYLLIAQCLTKIYLPDGRNAQILMKDINWWINKITPFCTILECKVGIKKKQIKDFIIWFRMDEVEK